jgi:hypothetical protein
MTPAICRSCGAETFWVTTKAGRKMMINREIVDPRKVAPADILVNEEGEVKQARNTNSGYQCMSDSRESAIAIGPKHVWHISHFYTCPDADRWRK